MAHIVMADAGMACLVMAHIVMDLAVEVVVHLSYQPIDFSFFVRLAALCQAALHLRHDVQHSANMLYQPMRGKKNMS